MSSILPVEQSIVACLQERGPLEYDDLGIDVEAAYRLVGHELGPRDFDTALDALVKSGRVRESRRQDFPVYSLVEKVAVDCSQRELFPAVQAARGTDG